MNSCIITPSLFAPPADAMQFWHVSTRLSRIFCQAQRLGCDLFPSSDPPRADRAPRCLSRVLSRSDLYVNCFYYHHSFLFVNACNSHASNHPGVFTSAETTTTRTSQTPTLPPGPKGGDPTHHLQQRQKPRVTTSSAAAGPTTSQGGPGPIAPRDGVAAGGAPETAAGGAGGAGGREGTTRVPATTATTLAGNERVGVGVGERQGEGAPGLEGEGQGQVRVAPGKMAAGGRSGERLCTGPGRRSGR